MKLRNTYQVIFYSNECLNYNVNLLNWNLFGGLFIVLLLGYTPKSEGYMWGLGPYFGKQ